MNIMAELRRQRELLAAETVETPKKAATKKAAPKKAAPKKAAPKKAATKKAAPKKAAPKKTARVGGLPAAPLSTLDELFDAEEARIDAEAEDARIEAEILAAVDELEEREQAGLRELARNPLPAPAAPAPAPAPAPAHLFDLESCLALISERIYGEAPRDAVLAALVARVAREHIRVQSEAGCGKSMMARLTWRIFGDEGGSHQFGAWSGPDSVFGPTNTKKLLQEDELERISEKGLFRGPVAFLDEVEKGSDAAQGLVLSALAERVLMDGAREIKIPLESAIATQNDEIAVAATADRFAFALTLPDQKNDAEFSKFGAKLSVNPPPPMPSWSQDELRRLQRRAAKLLLSAGDDFHKALADGVAAIVDATGGRISNRRFLALQRCCAAFGALRGASHLSAADTYALRWAAPEPHQHATAQATIDTRLGRLSGSSEPLLPFLLRGEASAEGVVGNV